MRYQSVGSEQWAVGSGRRFRARREDAAAKRNYHLPPTTYHLPPTTYHLPPTAYRLPPGARREDAAAKRNYHLPPTTYHLPPTTYHLPPTAYRLPPTTYRLPPTAYRLPPTTYRLPPTAYRLPFRGVTLIEMLIVVAIIAILAVAAARTMQPALEGRRIREAARAVNVYLGVARNHALATGRPCGVLIRRFPNLPECSMVLEQVEQPAPYAGNTIGATATLTATIVGNIATVMAALTPAINTALVSDGDLVQFNHQGPFYEIVPGGVTATLLTLQINLSQGQMVPWDSSPSDPVPYKIFRSPTKTAVGPLQLPTGTVIDLEASGIGNTTNFTHAAGGMSVIIMFSPNGSVDRCYVGNNTYRVTEPIFLMIGKRENIPGTDNVSDFTNIWIAINPQTGLITTAEVASDSGNIYDSRDFARQAQSMGGR